MDIPDPPPPPYSETDIYSSGHSNQPINGTDARYCDPSSRPHGRPVSSASTSGLQPAAVLSSSNQSEVNFTPSASDRRNNSVSESSFPVSSLSSAAAQDYFETRPLPTGFFQDHHVTQTISLISTSRPDDFPYRQEWARRDVSSSDWQTFLNFLLPNHATARNEAVIDRKLLAETDNTTVSASSGRAHASVHLNQLRRASAADVAVGSPALGVKREAEAVTAEWNAYFFQPRAMWVRLAFEPPRLQHQAEYGPHMPGAWGSSFDHHRPHHLGRPLPPSLPLNQPLFFHPYWAPQPQQQLQPARVSSSGFNFAGIKLNDEGFSIGNRFVVARNGVRVGGLVADTNGVSYRDNVIAGPGMFSGGFNHGYPGTVYHNTHPNVHHGPQVNAYYSRPVQAPGLPPGPGSLPGSFPTDDQKPHMNHDPLVRMPPESLLVQQHQRRESGSSTGSGSPASSDSSLSSLPDHDDLSVSQFPVFHRTLHAWLIKPEEHITKQNIQRLKAELAEAKRTRSEYPPQNVDSKIMRAEIKSLSQAFRGLKRAQRGIRRERRRERRARKKAERKERRGQRHGSGVASGAGGNPWGLPGPAPLTVPPRVLPLGPGPMTSPPGGFPPGAWNTGPDSAPPSALPLGHAPGMPGAHSGAHPGAPQAGGWSRVADQGQRGPGSQGHQAPDVLHQTSQDKFHQLDELEKRLARRCAQLDEARDGQLKRKEERENEAVSKPSGTQGEIDSVSAGKQVRRNLESDRLEEEVSSLTRDVERLRMEADEAFARELEEQERREAGAGR